MDRISGVALGDAGIAAVAALLTVYEAWLYRHRRSHREHLWLAAICASTAVHAGLLVFHYDATPELAVKLLKAELATIIIMCHCVPLYAMDKVQQRMPAPTWAFALSSVGWLALVPTPWVIPDTLDPRHYWLLEQPFLRRVETPLSILGVGYGLTMVLATVWWMWKRQDGQKQDLKHFAVGVVVWGLVAAYAGVFGALGWPVPTSTFEYGFVFFALALVAADVRRYMRMLATSERDFRAIVASSPEAVAIIQGGVVNHANPAFLATLSFDHPRQVENRSLNALVHADDRQQVASLLEMGVASPLTSARFRRHDQKHVELELVALPIELDGASASVLLARNVTERKRMTARRMEMDRIISMGTLAAGIGHEINNPLAYVLLSLEEAQSLLSEGKDEARDEDLAELITTGLDGVRRIRAIAEGLALFSRADRHLEPLELSPVIRTAADITANQIKLRATLELDLEDGLRVKGNETRLVQVFVNLLINAAQAIPEGQVGDNEVRVVTRRNEDGAILCEVRDTGVGIDPTLLKRIFEPFYTTKARGQGTGLGLGICRDSVQYMGGTLTVESEKSEGTTFCVRLPACAEETPEPPPPSSFPAGRRLRVLVVDDELQILRALQRLLQTWADVTAAPSVDEALDLMAQNKPSDLILSDLMMPGRSGMELYEEVIDEDPELAERFVFMTGGTFTDEAHAFRRHTKARFLDKPIGSKELGALLKRIEPRASRHSRRLS
ncbi:MAG: hybrid sensor histidine kinase/response regulator [Deltaproteobacteria bacterium]|nr:hybrid sensor histidine kinase/response regulator [Deltaproteobacteria bacterium]